MKHSLKLLLTIFIFTQALTTFAQQDQLYIYAPQH